MIIPRQVSEVFSFSLTFFFVKKPATRFGGRSEKGGVGK